ncbi:hypothetical protein Salat_0659700 [Sesamum alatum]|uniref:Uncharacterized protein n=1 Tax=Sesamum alatum TaxID=300844 RepID=A0AAE1YRS0_9LAMI|nr:hypothetical protein Salat_0659700 [Sesamum alatum]
MLFSTSLVIFPSLALDYFVESLIDTTNRKWKSDIIDTVFHPDDALAIKYIPPSPFYAEDCLIWIREKHGKFTVRGAHHATVSLRQSTLASSSSPFSVQDERLNAREHGIQILLAYDFNFLFYVFAAHT